MTTQSGTTQSGTTQSGTIHTGITQAGTAHAGMPNDTGRGRLLHSLLVAGLFVVLALIAAACSADSASVDTVTFNPVDEFDVTASEADESTETTPESDTDGADSADRADSAEDVDDTAAFDAPDQPVCEIEIVEDEYGFQVEISSCDDETTNAAPTSFLTLEEYVGSDAARTLSAGIRDRLVLQSGCAGGVIDGVELTPGPAVRDAALAIPDPAFSEAVTNLFASLSSSDDVCTDTAAWAAATRSALAEMQNLESLLTDAPGALLTSRPGEAEDLTLVTADVVAHYDRLYVLLNNVKPIEGSDLWYSSAHLAHLRGLRTMIAAGEELDAIVIGSSVMARAIDPIVLSDATGVSVVNASMSRSSIPIHAREMDEILSLVQTPTTILWGELSHRYFRGDCALPELPQIDEPLARQRSLFSGVSGLENVPALDVLFGSDPLNPVYTDTPIFNFSEENGPWDRGYQLPILAAPNGAKLADDAARLYGGNYVNPIVCDAQVEFAVDAIERWTTAGHTVVIIAAPLSNELAGLHPQGRAGHTELNARLEKEFSDAGASFLDYSELLGPGTFADPTHPNNDGRQLVTGALTDALPDLF